MRNINWKVWILSFVLYLSILFILSSLGDLFFHRWIVMAAFLEGEYTNKALSVVIASMGIMPFPVAYYFYVSRKNTTKLRIIDIVWISAFGVAAIILF